MKNILFSLILIAFCFNACLKQGKDNAPEQSTNIESNVLNEAISDDQHISDEKNQFAMLPEIMNNPVIIELL